MALSYTQMSQPLIANTIMHEGHDEEGNFQIYKINAAEGYVLHDKRGDSPIYDDDGNQTETKPRFRLGTASVPASYDFENVAEDTYDGINGTVQVQKAGMYEFYAIPASEVPECDKW